MKKLVITLLAGMAAVWGGATLAVIGSVRNSALAEGSPKVLINELAILWGSMIAVCGLAGFVVVAVMFLARIDL